MFAPLNRTLASESDAASHLGSGRIQRSERRSMYIRAREKAFAATNIQTGWRATVLYPLTTITVLGKLQPNTTPRPSAPRAPGRTSILDLSLLTTSPAEGTELRQANQVFNSQICNVAGVPSPAKKYSQRMTRGLEGLQSQFTIL